MIEVKYVTKRFDKVTAIDRLDVSFQSGITGLVGENGAGKSTLLRMIAGVYTPDEGGIFIDGIPAQEKAAKANVFFLPDDPYAPRGANIAGTLDYYRGLFDINRPKFNFLIDLFHLPKDKSVYTFSKGMRRQLFVALALSVNAQYLLLDEAFDGLDPIVVDSIKGEILSCVEQGKVIVISSHNISALERLVDRFVIISGGRIAKEEESEELGREFVKFQAAFTKPVFQEDLEKAGYNVLSFRKIGSVTHFVLIGKEEMRDSLSDAFPSMFLESVPLDPDEIVMLEMLMAKRGGK